MLEPRVRRMVALALLASGVVMAVAGGYVMLRTDMVLVGGVIFGAGILDVVLGLFFLRGA